MTTFPGLPAVDRRLFIPETVWVTNDESDELQWVPLSRKKDPDKWEKLVAMDDAIATQIKDGLWPESSSSAPWVMAQMIAALDLKPGMRILEIGTGTGWNAACLAALGADVVTIEVDPGLAEQARRNLLRAGYEHVRVVAGDGELGVPDEAPFDRVIATAAAHTIPWPWVAQTKDGGVIVVPYTGPGQRSGMVVLSVRDGKAFGKVQGEAAFMPLRGQRLGQAALQAIDDRADLYLEVGPSGQKII